MLELESEDLFNQSESSTSYPRYLEVIPQHTIETDKIPLSSFEEVLSKVPVYDVFSECTSCNGSGEEVCNCCGNEVNCEYCNGTGETKIKIGTKRQRGHWIERKGVCYAVHNIEPAFKVAKLFGLSELPIYHYASKKALVAKVEGITILVMPYLVTDFDRETTYKI